RAVGYTCSALHREHEILDHIGFPTSAGEKSAATHRGIMSVTLRPVACQQCTNSNFCDAVLQDSARTLGLRTSLGPFDALTAFVRGTWKYSLGAFVAAAHAQLADGFASIVIQSNYALVWIGIVGDVKPMAFRLAGAAKGGVSLWQQVHRQLNRFNAIQIYI